MRWRRTLSVINCQAEGEVARVIVDAAGLGVEIVPDEARKLCAVGERIKAAAVERLAVSHPETPDTPGITNTEFVGPVRTEGDAPISRNTAGVRPGRCDRSPCGTATPARLAVTHAKGHIRPEQTRIGEFIAGSRFICAIDGTPRAGPDDAHISAIAGQARITGLYQMGMDPTDPCQDGFTLSESWGN